MERTPLADMVGRGMSLASIAAASGLHPSTVSYWLRKHGLEAAHAERFARRGAPPRDLLEELAASGATLREMADAIDRSVATVRHWLKAWQIERLAVGSPRRPDDPAKAPQTAQMTCRHHGEAAFRLEGRGVYRCTQCRQEHVSRRRRKIKRMLVEEAGGACVACGYNACVAALQFHHLDRASKEFSLSAEGMTRSLTRARAEAAKCVLLCANCHAEVESGFRTVPAESSPGWIRTTKN